MGTPITLANPSAGWRTDLDAALLPQGACQDVLNMSFANGTWRSRAGRTRHDRIAIGTSPLADAPRALAEYSWYGDTLGFDDGLNHSRFVLAASTKLYYTTSNDQKSWTEITDADLDATHAIHMLQHGNWLYIVDGVSAVKRWNPTDGLEVLNDLDAPTVAPAITVNGIQAEIGDCRHGDTYGLCSKKGDRYRKVGGANSWTCTTWDGDNDEIEGACARLVRGDASTTGGHATAIAFEVIGKGNDTNGYAMTGNATWQQTLLKPMDLRQVEALSLRIRPEYDTNDFKRMGFAFSQDGTTWQKFNVALTGLASGVWATVEIDISSVEMEDRSQVSYLQFTTHVLTGSDSSGCESGTAKRVNYAGRGTLSTNIYGVQKPDGSAAHLDHYWVATALLLDGVYTDAAGSTTQKGKYEFTYTYSFDPLNADSELEGPAYVNPDASTDITALPYPTVVVNDLTTFGFEITVYKDQGVQPYFINVYARSELSAGSFRRIAEIPACSTINASTAGLSRVDNVVTLTTSVAHGIAVGDSITVAGSSIFTGSGSFDGTFTVISKVEDRNDQVTYAQAGVDATGGHGTVAVSRSIDTVTRTDEVVTVLCTTAHGFMVGESVVIAGTVGGATIDGTYTIDTVPATPADGSDKATSFTYEQVETDSLAAGGTATVSWLVAAPGASRASNIVTITCNAAHPFAVGDLILVEGITPASFDNVTGTLAVASLPAGIAESFTYAQTAANAQGGGGYVWFYAAHAFTATWDGSYPSDAEFLVEYINVPPEGCSNLYAWRERMVYVLNDTLYISNYDNPMRVPQVAIEDSPSYLGGWRKVGTDGTPIIGCGVFGSYLIPMKRGSDWLLQGTGSTDFSLVQMATSINCSSSDTICQVPGQLLAWLDDKALGGWDGQQFNDPKSPNAFGRALDGFLKTKTLADQRAAMALYDADTKCLMLRIGGEMAVYESAGTWTKWDDLNIGAWIYSYQAEKQGVYAAVQWWTGGPVDMLVLNDGDTDVTSDASVDAAIACSWTSGEFDAGSGRYQDCVRVSVTAGLTMPVASVVAAVMANGADYQATPTATQPQTGPVTLAVPTAPGESGIATWRPGLIPDAVSHALRVAFSTRATVELTQIQITLNTRGAVR